MRDAILELLAIQQRGGAAAMATLVRTWRSAPRQPGASMLITDAGEAIGSVSGGCIEAALYDLGQEVLADGNPRYETFGVSDDDAFAVGLTCGGVLEVFVERVDATTWPELAALAASIEADDAVAIATVINARTGRGAHRVVWHDRATGTTGDSRRDEAVASAAREVLRQGGSAVVEIEESGDSIFVQSFVPKPRMFVFGVTDYASALVKVGKLIGYRVTVVDARATFATTKRFPEADEVVVDWPHRWLEQQRVDESTVIAVLTHDPKFDVPAIQVAMKTPAGYIGAIGSRRTHEDRIVRLKEVGLTDDELARLHSPIGLDIGSRTPEETAISIAAEVIRANRQKASPKY